MLESGPLGVTRSYYQTTRKANDTSPGYIVSATMPECRTPIRSEQKNGTGNPVELVALRAAIAGTGTHWIEVAIGDHIPVLPTSWCVL